jgi:hypothetical protein
MVERPIKRSERLAQAATEGTTAPSEATGGRPEGRGERSEGRGERRKGKGKGGRRDQEQEKPPVNPALQRGPRPAKAVPVPEPVAEETPTDETTGTGGVAEEVTAEEATTVADASPGVTETVESPEPADA